MPNQSTPSLAVVSLKKTSAVVIHSGRELDRGRHSAYRAVLAFHPKREEPGRFAITHPAPIGERTAKGMRLEARAPLPSKSTRIVRPHESPLPRSYETSPPERVHQGDRGPDG